MHRLSLITRTRLIAGAILASAFWASACGPAGLSESAQRGRTVFLESSKPNCSVCHQLMHAGSPKSFGPDLDMLRPTREQTIQSVTDGVKIMPAQKGILTPEQIEDVANYLVEVAGK